VLGAGSAFLVLVLAGVTAFFGYAEAGRISGRRAEPARRSVATAAAARLGLPPGPAVGIGFAFEPAPGRSARPAWPHITGTIMALVIVVASLIASLSALVSHPALYGWTGTGRCWPAAATATSRRGWSPG
jgi:hypothetical protein